MVEPPSRDLKTGLTGSSYPHEGRWAKEWNGKKLVPYRWTHSNGKEEQALWDFGCCGLNWYDNNGGDAVLCEECYHYVRW